MNSNFIILNRTYQTTEFLTKIIANFPNKDTVLKNYMEKVMYEMIEDLLSYNINDVSRIKEKYIKDYLIKLSMLNYLTKQALLKKYMTIKQVNTVGRFYIDLKKMASALIKGYTIESLL